MKSKLVPIKSIKTNPKNPRVIRDEKFQKLVKSIQEFPKMLDLRPIVVNKSMMVLGGNQRLKACIEAGLKEVPILIADELTKAEQERFIITDNVNFGDWDFSDLNANWNLESLENWGLDIDFGLDETKIEAKEDDYEIPEEIKTDIVLGDLFEIGEHRLLCGDSTSSADINKLLIGIDPDIIVIDPPYEMEEMYPKSISHIKITDTNRLLVMWDFKRFATAPKYALDYGWTPQYEFIWDCVQSWYTQNRPLQRHKTMGVFGINPKFDLNKAIITDGKDRGKKRIVTNTRGESEYEPLDGAKHISTVEQFSNCQQTNEHGHGKPIQWISAIMGGLCVGGGIVYDAFSGGGAFMIASHQLNRKCYGMELDPKYCQVIIDRMLKLDPTLEIKKNGKKYVRIKKTK